MIILKRKDSTVYIMKDEITYMDHDRGYKSVEVHYKDGKTIVYNYINSIEFK